MQIENKSILYTSSIKEALQLLNKSGIQILCIVENGKLLGTLTDGDIRRGLLNNYNLDSSLENIFFKTPLIFRKNVDNKKEIIKLAKKRKINHIPVVDSENNLLEIETISDLSNIAIKKNRVVLMVGGLGTRLKPLTNNIPKPMLKVGGKPILETIISNFKKYGFINIILSVNYKSEIIKNYFKDGSDFGVNIEYIDETQRMGTAGALSLMRDKLQDDPFFVMNGDLLTDINFNNMLNFHIAEKATATMGVREYKYQIPYGVVNVENSMISSIQEKPFKSVFINGGIYILNPDTLKYIPDNQFFDMPTLFEYMIKEKYKTLSFPIHEYWLDIGRIEEFEKANSEFQEVFS